MSPLTDELPRPQVFDKALDEGYRAMAADKAREAEALEWCNALLGTQPMQRGASAPEVAKNGTHR
jgi:hypothetical protein